MSHARIAPSSAGCWCFCPGSVAMKAQFPKEGDDGKAGEASHWVGAEYLGKGITHVAGETAPNGVVLDAEMVGGARCYTDAVHRALAGHQTPYHYVEQPLPIQSVHAECFGTPDDWYYLPSLNELHTWDLKFGWKIVEVIGNMQLTCYAAGGLDCLSGWLGVPLPVLDQQTTVVFHIVQPRPYHPLGCHREWRVNAATLRNNINLLREAAAKALSPNPECVSGPHCRYCEALHACPAARQSLYAAMDFTESAVPHELNPEQLGLQLAVVERAEQAVKFIKAALESQALGIINQGGIVPGWAVERGVGRSTWAVPAPHVIEIGKLYGKDLQKPVDAITPYQAKQLGLPADVINPLSNSPLGDPKLVPSSKTIAATLFGLLTKE